MTSYAKVKWDIIEKWNSDAKYDNQYLIQMASDNGVEIRNERADRKSIVAKVSDSVIKSGIESGDYSVTEWGTFSQEQINFENYMGSLMEQFILIHILMMKNIHTIMKRSLLFLSIYLTTNNKNKKKSVQILKRCQRKL